MPSLLGQFYHRIKGSQEDFASEGLVYILQQSADCKEALNGIVKSATKIELPSLNFETQRTGEKGERPDISGTDENFEEQLIIEAKFWASLTQNQPNAYLERLGANTVLIFLVPSLRRYSIFPEILNRLLYAEDELIIDSERLTIEIKPLHQHIMVLTWDDLLTEMKAKLLKSGNDSLSSDLNQIIGLCESIDQAAFQPLVEEDLSPGIAKRIVSYHELVDKVVDALKSDNSGLNISTKGLLKTPRRYGYHRYFSSNQFGLGMTLKLDFWEQHADSPLWLFVSGGDIENIWQITPRTKKAITQYAKENKMIIIDSYKKDSVFLALPPKLFETEDHVIQDLVKRILKIIQYLNE